ncbi:hypothetical protein LXA47_03925 [Massilia sp. P8910]|uniref:hypothetical protein n=1 Tax=Massilia antarctica TaxID=2765360 RepID=UPI001E38BA09|nr:hypothetical protein [Massilia antarctica]MCE3602746.1 hypothetical protein [Massilia antarctica]
MQNQPQSTDALGDLKSSNFYKAGREARAGGIPLAESALRMMNPGCSQYYEFMAGYDSKPEAK